MAALPSAGNGGYASAVRALKARPVLDHALERYLYHRDRAGLVAALASASRGDIAFYRDRHHGLAGHIRYHHRRHYSIAIEQQLFSQSIHVYIGNHLCRHLSKRVHLPFEHDIPFDHLRGAWGALYRPRAYEHSRHPSSDHHLRLDRFRGCHFLRALPRHRADRRQHNSNRVFPDADPVEARAAPA